MASREIFHVANDRDIHGLRCIFQQDYSAIMISATGHRPPVVAVVGSPHDVSNKINAAIFIITIADFIGEQAKRIYQSTINS